MNIIKFIAFGIACSTLSTDFLGWGGEAGFLVPACQLNMPRQEINIIFINNLSTFSLSANLKLDCALLPRLIATDLDKLRALQPSPPNRNPRLINYHANDVCCVCASRVDVTDWNKRYLLCDIASCLFLESTEIILENREKAINHW